MLDSKLEFECCMHRGCSGLLLWIRNWVAGYWVLEEDLGLWDKTQIQIQNRDGCDHDNVLSAPHL